MKKNILPVIGVTLLLQGMLGTVPAMATSGSSVDSTVNPMSNLTDEAKQKLADTLKNQAKISKDKAIDIAKGIIEIPDGYKQDNVSFNTNWYPDNRSVWQINWNKSDGRVNGSISITVDANSGNVLAINRYTNNPDQKVTYPPKVDHNKAIEIAQAFIAKQFPDKLNELAYDEQPNASKPPLNGNVHYTLRFVRTVHNIQFEDNYISVTIDGDGHITGMNYRWNDHVTFPSATSILPKVKAEQNMRTSLPLQLQYLTLYGVNQNLPKKELTPKVVLTYRNAGNFTMLDAKTGQWRDFSGQILKTDEAYTNLKPLVDKPLASAPSSGPEMSQSQAEAYLIKVLNLPGDLKMHNANYNNNWGTAKEPVWQFNWAKTDHQTSVNAVINAKTGEILSYNLYDPTLYQSSSTNDNWTANVTYDEAKQRAVNILKKLVPYKLNQLVFNPLTSPKPTSQSQPRVYHFTYQRLVNGIIVPYQSINVGINTETGDMVNFYQNWSNQLTFPKPENTVSIDKAKSPYLKNFTFNLVYKLVRPNPVTFNQTDQSNNLKVILVYELKQKNQGEPVYFDANKNQWESQKTGEPVTQNKKATDISGNWAEKPLQLMLDYGALQLDKEGKVHPNQPITRGQMVKMLMLATNPNPIYYEKMASASSNQAFSDVSASSPYFSYIQVAAQKGWIDQNKKTYKPNDPVTREEIADLIVHALNYNKLANVKGLFNLDFKDAGKITKVGDVAIVSHLGIMKGADGYFRPDEIATRAQAATAFYQFLKNQGQYGK